MDLCKVLCGITVAISLLSKGKIDTFFFLYNETFFFITWLISRVEEAQDYHATLLKMM